MAIPLTPGGFRIYDQNETTVWFTWFTVENADRYGIDIYQGASRVAYDHSIFGNTKAFTGLTPGVSYTAYLFAINTDGTSPDNTLSFKLSYDRPQDFAWTLKKGRGLSYTLVDGKFIDLISFEEMTEIRKRINEFRRYKGLLAYNYTPIAEGDDFTETLYSELNNAISAMNPPTPTPGTRLSGAGDLPGLLNGLRDSLNSL